MKRRNWTREELIVTINVYCKLTFGQLHHNNPEIISLSKLINRTPSSVTWKLANFASLDPSLQERGIKGARHRSKLDEDIWNEFINNWKGLSYESELILAKLKNQTVEKSSNIETDDLPKEGKERETIVKTRVNQHFFRRTVLASYNFKCCITGISITELLVAGHIIPWSLDPINRMNPRNGLCLNALHDKAFDSGLMTISEDFRIINSTLIKERYNNKSIKVFFGNYNCHKISLPDRFLPDNVFLEYHRSNIFKN